MSSPTSTLRKRGGMKEAPDAVVPADTISPAGSTRKTVVKRTSEWDYWLAMVVLTLLGFATRFYKISYPNEVVFDEVHFGKVRSLLSPKCT